MPVMVIYCSSGEASSGSICLYWNLDCSCTQFPSRVSNTRLVIVVFGIIVIYSFLLFLLSCDGMVYAITQCYLLYTMFSKNKKKRDFLYVLSLHYQLFHAMFYSIIRNDLTIDDNITCLIC